MGNQSNKLQFVFTPRMKKDLEDLKKFFRTDNATEALKRALADRANIAKHQQKGLIVAAVDLNTMKYKSLNI